MTRFLALLLLTAASGSSNAVAESASGATTDRRVEAAPAGSMSVDGVLDEPEWKAARPATGFVQYEPNAGSPSAQPSAVRVLAGTDALYIGAELNDSSPEAIRRTLSRRDDTGGADAFSVAIDSYDDGRTARLFGVTAAGVQFDALVEGNGDDDSWDAVWASGVRVTPRGWTVEIRIPYSQLRFNSGSTGWGINFIREIPRLGEESYWAPFTRDQASSGIVQFFGRLEGIAGVRPRRLVQAIPYTLASGSRGESPLIPGEADYGNGADAGIDLKLGLSPGVILDATVNPDFGQVEADPAELNLSTFETFFEERRPFFLEGTQIFDSGFSRDGALLYTRRIGGSAPIVGATKLTGRTARGLSFGTIAAATGEDFDPSRFYGVARVRQEFGGQNFVGTTVSAFDATRDITAAPGAGARSLVAATDWSYRFGPYDRFQYEGVLSGSLRDQEDDVTARGFALYTGLDQIQGFRTFGSGLRIYSPGYRNNDIGRFRETDRLSANFAIGNEWNQGVPFGPFRRLNTFVFSTGIWTYTDAKPRGFELGTRTSGQLRGFQDIGLSTSLNGIGGYDVRETRGRGPVRNVMTGSIELSISTDQRRTFVAELEGSLGGDASGGLSLAPAVSIDWVASDRIQLSASAAFTAADGMRAWAANEGLILGADGRLFLGRTSRSPSDYGSDDLIDSGLTPTEAATLLAGLTPEAGPVVLDGGTGFVAPLFASRDYRSADLTARANVIFNPSLSLQLYSQLFAARGRYRDYTLLASPEELRDFDAYPKRRDFTATALTANAVLRWEYRPGSSVYVVWQRASGDDLFEEVLRDEAPLSPFESTVAGQFGDLLGAFADDVVLIKVSYLFMR